MLTRHEFYSVHSSSSWAAPVGPSSHWAAAGGPSSHRAASLYGSLPQRQVKISEIYATAVKESIFALGSYSRRAVFVFGSCRRAIFILGSSRMAIFFLGSSRRVFLSWATKGGGPTSSWAAAGGELTWVAAADTTYWAAAAETTSWAAAWAGGGRRTSVILGWRRKEDQHHLGQHEKDEEESQLHLG